MAALERLRTAPPEALLAETERDTGLRLSGAAVVAVPPRAGE
jgi:hypothetical protein